MCMNDIDVFSGKRRHIQVNHKLLSFSLYGSLVHGPNIKSHQQLIYYPWNFHELWKDSKSATQWNSGLDLSQYILSWRIYFWGDQINQQDINNFHIVSIAYCLSRLVQENMIDYKPGISWIWWSKSHTDFASIFLSAGQYFTVCVLQDQAGDKIKHGRSILKYQWKLNHHT